jgi:hypothetical protein
VEFLDLDARHTKLEIDERDIMRAAYNEFLYFVAPTERASERATALIWGHN